MKTIIVGFSKPKTWKPFATAIMWAYNIPYSHVYLKFHSDSYQRDIIYQASSIMVNFMSTAVFNEHAVITDEYVVPISDENYVKMMQFCIDNAGKPYSLKEAFGFALVVIARACGKKISNPFKQGTSEWVCSVIATYILENFADKAVPGDFTDADPATIHDYLQSL
jgi:hypothetical protein